ncbi:MAG TPA: alpha/beta fold hydrolase [Xanthobacteraceae bacterium]|nr:alpha/beta fold hydrolase [Xanthobacteraceae bacterium]
MEGGIPAVLVPGLNCSARVYAPQLPALWQFGPVQIANHRQGDSMAAIAKTILDHAPPRFALAGFSMGGYIALEILRQARERVLRLALIDTAAAADRPEQTEKRRKAIALTQEGKAAEREEALWPLLVHESRINDDALRSVVKAMHQETGTEAYINQQTAIMNRVDSRPLLAELRMKTLIVVGDSDQLTPPAAAKEMHELVAGSKLDVIPNCGHMSLLERPDRVTKLLVEWLAE